MSDEGLEQLYNRNQSECEGEDYSNKNYEDLTEEEKDQFKLEYGNIDKPNERPNKHPKDE